LHHQAQGLVNRGVGVPGPELGLAAPGGGSPSPSFAAAAALVLAFGVAAAGHAGEPSPRSVVPRTARGASRKLPPLGPGGRDKGGASDVSILDGAAISARMHQARGRGLFVHVWASWCGPCIEELSTIDLFARATRARGGTFLSISLDDVRRADRVAEVLHQRAPSLTRIVARFDDPDGFMALFSHEWEGAIPALFAYDAGGRLVASLLGEADVEDLDRLLEDLTAPVAAPRPPMGPTPGAGRRP
jgi:thiol-disulfide isomerase/thioredoxin